MKISVIYNHESRKVIGLSGIQNREKYGLTVKLKNEAVWTSFHC